MRDPEVPHPSPTTSAVAYERSALVAGVLALFGLQLGAVFSSAFQAGLDRTEQKVHLAAIALVALAITALLTPTAYLHQLDPADSLSRVTRVTRRALQLGMLALAIAIPLDVFVAACVILRGQIAIALGLAAPVLFFVMWFVIPAAQGRAR